MTWPLAVIAGAAIGILLATQGGAFMAPGQSPAIHGPGEFTGSIRIATADELPLVFLVVPEPDEGVQRVAAAMRTGLSGFDTIEFIGRSPASKPDPVADPISFIFRVLPGREKGSVAVELQNIGSGRVLFSRNLAERDVEASKVDDTVASILSAAVPASGTIYAYLDQTDLDRGLAHCLLLNDNYYLDPNAGTHEKAYRCFEKLLAENGKSAIIYSEISALQIEAVTDGYRYPPDASTDTATAMAHRALQIASSSPYVYRANGFLDSRVGTAEESIRWMRRAYELNTYDLSMAAAYAYALIFAGRYAEGTPIMARAVDLSSAHPQWWDFALFAGALSLGNIRQAIRATGPLNPTGTKPHYLAARLVAANLGGDVGEELKLRGELTRRFPEFVLNPRAIFRHRNFPPDMTELLVRALRTAGLGTGS
jgi:hypothetical protein